MKQIGIAMLVSTLMTPRIPLSSLWGTATVIQPQDKEHVAKEMYCMSMTFLLSYSTMPWDPNGSVPPFFWLVQLQVEPRRCGEARMGHRILPLINAISVSAHTDGMLRRHPDDWAADLIMIVFTMW